MKKPPTDREILSKIYEQYYDDFCAYSDENKVRSSKIHVPIDCLKIAEKLNVDGDIVFGRLYYYLNKKHGYTQDDGSKVSLFSMKTGEDRHSINFPLLSALVAEQHTSWFRFNLPIVISSLALLIAMLKG